MKICPICLRKLFFICIHRSRTPSDVLIILMTRNLQSTLWDSRTWLGRVWDHDWTAFQPPPPATDPDPTHVKTPSLTSGRRAGVQKTPMFISLRLSGVYVNGLASEKDPRQESIDVGQGHSNLGAPGIKRLRSYRPAFEVNNAVCAPNDQHGPWGS